MELRSTRITFGVHCLQIRHKGMFVTSAPTTPEEDASGLYDADSYWCGKTSTAFGPDGQPTRPDVCQAGRGCCEQ
jgi:hypothetical protein